MVTRADSTSLYVTRDIAYHLSKFARFPRVIDVLGQDHRLHARSLEALLSEIGEARRPEFVIYQDLTVPEGGRMSTRKGTAVYLDTLLDEAVERARREVRARWEEATDDEVDAIAVGGRLGGRAIPHPAGRAGQDRLLPMGGRALVRGTQRSVRPVRLRPGDEPPTKGLGRRKPRTPSGEPTCRRARSAALVRAISRLPRVVEYAARTSHVHSVAGYGHDLAEAFNRFYQSVPVLKAQEERSSRLALVAASRDDARERPRPPRSRAPRPDVARVGRGAVAVLRGLRRLPGFPHPGEPSRLRLF